MLKVESSGGISKCGDFDCTDWSSYEWERLQAERQFSDLGRMIKMPDLEIPSAIDDYLQPRTQPASPSGVTERELC